MVALAGGISALAQAQQAAAPAPEPEHPRGGLGGHVALGEAFSPGVADAWVFRFEEEVLPVLPAPFHAGGLTAITFGFEYWRAGTGTWGLDLPLLVNFGVRAFPFRAMVGAGTDMLVLDQVGGDTGIGSMTPLAAASAGLDLFGVTVMVDARAAERWHWGSDDHFQWMVSLGVGLTLESKDRTF